MSTWARVGVVKSRWIWHTTAQSVALETLTLAGGNKVLNVLVTQHSKRYPHQYYHTCDHNFHFYLEVNVVREAFQKQINISNHRKLLYTLVRQHFLGTNFVLISSKNYEGKFCTTPGFWSIKIEAFNGSTYCPRPTAIFLTARVIKLCVPYRNDTNSASHTPRLMSRPHSP
jgi:hypothetical protein